MRTVSVSVDVEIDDFLYELSNNDRRYLMECLKEEGYIPEDFKIEPDGTLNQGTDSTLDRHLKSLLGKEWKLTKEEEETIINIAKKYDHG